MNLFEHLAPWVAGFLTAEIPPTRYGLANVPHFIRRPCPLAWGGLGWCPVGWCFRVVKPASSRVRTGRTLFGHGDGCSPQVRPRGGCGKAWSVASISPYGLLHRTSGWQALMLSRWWVADARVERVGARPNRAVVVKTALTCEFLISK
jgi:hypothetical protein